MTIRLEEMVTEEGRITDEILKISDKFIFLDQLFHWRLNFGTGIDNLNSISRSIPKKDSEKFKFIMSHHRNVRLAFHSLLQMPYILKDHIESNPITKDLILKDNKLKAIVDKFQEHWAVNLLLILRHKLVHEVLLDESVTVMSPKRGKEYLEITLPNNVCSYLLTRDYKGKSKVGQNNEQYFKIIFMTGTKGFIYLFNQYVKLLRQLEKDAGAEMRIILSVEFFERKKLIEKRSRLRGRMRKEGISFL